MSFEDIKKQMLACMLSPSQTPQALKSEIANQEVYYTVAKPGTTADEWQKREFAAFTDDADALVVFLSLNEAQVFAKMMGASIGEKPLVSKVSHEQLSKILAEYAYDNIIDGVKVYSTPPLYIMCRPEDFKDASAAEPQEEESAQTKPDTFKGVDFVRTVLDTYDNSARRAMDKGRICENIHTLIQSLIQQNDLDASALDKALDLPTNLTREFCLNRANSSYNQSILMKYLSYFGLQQYLYIFKGQSIELANYLKNHRQIDVYELKNPTINSERFVLKALKRGEDSKTGAYVYSAELANDKRKVNVILSNPLGLVIGKEYQIVGLSSQQEAAPQPLSAKLPTISEESIQQALSEINASQSPVHMAKGPRSYDEKRKDAIIRYFRGRNMNARDAEAKYKTLEMEPDILDEFYKYIENKQFGKLEVAGYTARKLIKQMGFDSYEAYLILAQLRSDPQNTKQRLIYRERDPQYQKKPSAPK